MENTNCNCLENIINKVNLVQDFINEKLLDINIAECSRINNEDLRIKNENSRKEAETKRVINEEARQDGYIKFSRLEDLYASNEEGRLLNELERINNENKRLLWESCRKDAENIRKELESSRQTAETLRTTSEINRIENENNRIIAEELREKVIADAKNTIKEAANVNAELDGTKISVTNRNGETKSLELVDIDEHVTVTIKSDVEGLSVGGTPVTVYRNHGEVPESYTTDAGGKVTFSVTRGTYYEVHFPEKSGAQLISPIGYTATLPVRSIEATYLSDGEGAYEAVTIETRKVNADNSKEVFPNVEISVQIGVDAAKTLTTDAEGKATFNVPIGKSYKVVFSEQAGFFLFYERNYTRALVADSLVRNIVFYYSSYKTGVYIVTQDRKEYTLDDFKSKDIDKTTAKMIAVYERSLMLNGGVIYASIDDLSNQIFHNITWCDQAVLFNDIPSDGNKTDAQYYYDGNGATNAIIKEAAERDLSVPAATYAKGRTITIGDKTMTGYLPSVGQFIRLYNNRTAVDDILKYVAGDTTKTMSSYFDIWKWTAAQDGAANAWLLFSGTLGSSVKTSYVNVACFFAY